jgi:hypothetical protein
MAKNTRHKILICSLIAALLLIPASTANETQQTQYDNQPNESGPANHTTQPDGNASQENQSKSSPGDESCETPENDDIPGVVIRCGTVYVLNCSGIIGYVIIVGGGDGQDGDCIGTKDPCSGSIGWISLVVGGNNQACTGASCSASIFSINYVVGSHNRVCAAGFSMSN